MSSPFEKGRPSIWDEKTDSISDLPKSTGAYRFIHRDDKTVMDYIGITNNIYTRICGHRSARSPYDPTIHVVHYQTILPRDWHEMWKELAQWEKDKIENHKPNKNKRDGGGGRTPTKFYFEGDVFELSADKIENISADEVEEKLETRGVLWKLKRYFF